MLRTAEIPPGRTVFDALDDRFGVSNAAAALPARTGWLQRYTLAVDLDSLAASCREVIQRFGLRGFRNTSDDTSEPAYGSLSLTCNPDNEGDPHSATLGSRHLRQGQYFYGTPETMVQMPQMRVTTTTPMVSAALPQPESMPRLASCCAASGCRWCVRA